MSCDYGDPSGAKRIIVVGDSHAVHWLPALELAAKNADWRINGMTKSSCAFTAELISFTSSGVSREYSECRAWGEALLAFLIEEQPDLVIFSHSPRHSLPNRSARDSQVRIAAGIVQYADTLREAGIKVAAIEHTPWQAQDVPRCMALPDASATSCTTPETVAIRPGTIEKAVAIDPGIAMIETRPYFCQSGACPVVIGGVLVYRDAHHLTATYSRTLAPIMEQRIRELL